MARTKISMIKEDLWDLRLYVAGQTTRSVTAFAKAKKICEEHLAGRYRLEVVDLLVNPQMAKDEQIVAVPTLVRRRPAPPRRLIGDLSNMDRTLMSLDLCPQG